MPSTIEIDARFGECAIIRLTGQLDIHTVEKFHKVMECYVRPRMDLIIDFKGVTIIDGKGLLELLALTTICQDAGKIIFRNVDVKFEHKFVEKHLDRIPQFTIEYNNAA